MGELAVRHGERRWTGRQIGTRLARKLLALMTIEAGHVVTVDTVVGRLWPSVPPQRPAANIATLVSRLRATFGSDIIIGDGNGYRLGERVNSDLSIAAELIASAEAQLAARQPLSARTAAEEALRLVYDEVLPELSDQPWILPARTQRLSLRHRAWQTAAEAALLAGDPGSTLVIAEAATAAEPLDEAVCRIAMRAYDALHQPAKAVRMYNKFRLALANDLGIDPAPPTRALYLTILRKAAGTTPGSSSDAKPAAVTSADPRQLP